MEEKDEILEEVQQNVVNTQFPKGVWYADYKRIRIKATNVIKLKKTAQNTSYYW